MWHVVGFYTKNTPYAEEAERLKESCSKFGIKYQIYEIESRLNWTENCAQKPFVIKQALIEYPNKDIVYLDVDARIRKYPSFFDTIIGDMAVHYRQPGNELLSGTIFFRNNKAARTLVDLWCRSCAADPSKWDQKVLQQVIQDNGQICIIAELPATYVQIFDLMAGNGEPVIEHLQASRRFKKVVSIDPEAKMIPNAIAGIRIRKHEDGTVSIPRQNNEAIRWLDQHCTRIPHELRWQPNIPPNRAIDNLRHLFEGKPCYIVGKGPSLDFVQPCYFTNKKAPIICINEAIHKIEALELPNPVFMIQQDHALKATCKPTRGAIPIVSVRASDPYINDPKAIIFIPEQFGLCKTTLTALCAIAIAKHMGTTEFNMVSFDSCTNGQLEYAKCIGYSATRGGDLNRFRQHRNRFLQAVAPYPCLWVIPGEPSYDKQPQSQDSPVGRHDLGMSQPSTVMPDTSGSLSETESFQPDTHIGHSE